MIVGILWLLLFASIITTIIGLNLLVKSRWESENVKVETIIYWGFWRRFLAYLIDYVLSLLIIPAFISMYYHFKDGQTIWYKVMGLKICNSEDLENIKVASFMKLFFYPLSKLINIITLFIGYIMIWVTEKKQGLHNMINSTVVVRVD